MGGVVPYPLPATECFGRKFALGRAACGDDIRLRIFDIWRIEEGFRDLIPAIGDHKYLVDPSIPPVRTRCRFTITSMIQVCSSFH